MSHLGLTVPGTLYIEKSGAGATSAFVNTAYKQKSGTNVFLAYVPRYSVPFGGPSYADSVFGRAYGSNVAPTEDQMLDPKSASVVGVPSTAASFHLIPHMVPAAAAVADVVRPPVESGPFLLAALATTNGIQ